jgi:hypothetical protein
MELYNYVFVRYKGGRLVCGSCGPALGCQVVLKMFMFTVQIIVRFVLDSLCNWRLQIVPSLRGTEECKEIETNYLFSGHLDVRGSVKNI